MPHILFFCYYVPKEGFVYPNGFTAGDYRPFAHSHMFAMERFFGQKVSWEIVQVEKISESALLRMVQDPKYDALFLSGSPYLLREDIPWMDPTRKAIETFFDTQPGKPTFGVCFGFEVLAELFGGRVGTSGHGFTTGEVIMHTKEGKDIPTLSYHEDYIQTLPASAQVHATGPRDMPYLLKFSERCWGVQSHPERVMESAESNTLADAYWREFFHKNYPTLCVEQHRTG